MSLLVYMLLGDFSAQVHSHGVTWTVGAVEGEGHSGVG